MIKGSWDCLDCSISTHDLLTQKNVFSHTKCVQGKIGFARYCLTNYCKYSNNLNIIFAIVSIRCWPLKILLTYFCIPCDDVKFTYDGFYLFIWCLSLLKMTIRCLFKLLSWVECTFLCHKWNRFDFFISGMITKFS